MIWFFFLASTVLGMLGAWLIWRFAPILGLVDEPSARGSHFRPTPRGGGIGIAAAFIFCALYFGIPTRLWGPCFFVALVSLLDDRISLPPGLRLATQAGAALIILPALPLVWTTGWLAGMVLVIFLLATGNFFNFMDGINGMAALAGAVSFGLLSLFVVHMGKEPVIGEMSLCIAFACLGFLPFNFPRANVFLGDIGSIVLGFTFAVLSARVADSFLELIILAGFLLPFYGDTLTTLWVRCLQGENLLQAHRQHLYQILVHRKRCSHWQVSCLYAAIQLSAGLLLLWQCRAGHQWAATMCVLVLLIAFGGISLCFRAAGTRVN